jgi:SM-20-related protein
MIENIFAKPPPYGSISNWLGPETVQRLLDFAQMRRDSFVPTGIGHAETAKVDVNIRRSSRVKDLGDLKKELRTKIREVLPAMFRRLGADVFEPGRLEVEMVAHGDGAFFTEHRDTAIEGQKLVVRRVISAVYYFHRLPKSFSGGVCGFIP